MRSLLIDTTQPIALLGLMENETLTKIEKISGSKQLCSTLFPALRTFCNISTLEAIGVGVGPGSYIGIRTGASIGQTLSYALHIPVIEFSSTLLLIPPKTQGSFTYFGDAKMGELFAIEGKVANGTVYLEPPLLIPKKPIPLSLLTKDSLFGESYSHCEPHFDWVVIHMATSLSQRPSQLMESTPIPLPLEYLR